MSGEKVPLEVPRGVKKDETPEEREARLEKERLLGKDELQQRQKEAETKATETTKADVQSGKDLVSFAHALCRVDARNLMHASGCSLSV